MGYERMSRKDAELFADALPQKPVEQVARKLGITVKELLQKRAESREKLIEALLAYEEEGVKYP